jgi:hypothetical protein
MSIQSTTQNYPVESINSRSRTEKRWDDDVKIFSHTGDEWQISIGNGKRLDRKWRNKGGIAFVRTAYGETTVYNHKYDVALNEAKRAQYDRSLQPDGNPSFYRYKTNNWE